MQKRRTALLVGGLIGVGAVVAVLVTVAGGDSRKSPSPGEERFAASANRICARSDAATRRVRGGFPLGDRFPPEKAIPIIVYAQRLLDISTPTAARLAALQPPEDLRGDYEKFVEAEQQIYYDDLTAVHAAHAVHPSEYLAARKRQRRERQEGYEWARAVGLEECAPH